MRACPGGTAAVAAEVDRAGPRGRRGASGRRPRRPCRTRGRSPSPARLRSPSPVRPRGPTRVCSPRRTATMRARIDSAISSGVRAPMSSPAGVSSLARRSSVTPSACKLGDHGRAAHAAGHQADVGQVRLEPAPQRAQLVAPVCRDDQREVVGHRLDVGAGHDDHVEVELGAHARHGAGDRRLAHHEHARRGEHRLEEDLQRAAGQARVLHGHRALGRGRLVVAGQDAQQQRLAGLERAQRVQAHALLRARSADETLDRAVAAARGRRRPCARWSGAARAPRSRRRTASARPAARRHDG